MHPVQKKAIYAMVDAVENQLRYIKSLILMDEEPAPAPAAARSSVPRSTQSEYLDESEEGELEESLEAARLAALSQQQEVADQWEIQRRIISQETTL